MLGTSISPCTSSGLFVSITVGEGLIISLVTFFDLPHQPLTFPTISIITTTITAPTTTLHIFNILSSFGSIASSLSFSLSASMTFSCCTPCGLPALGASFICSKSASEIIIVGDESTSSLLISTYSPSGFASATFKSDISAAADIYLKSGFLFIHFCTMTERLCGISGLIFSSGTASS